MDLDFPRGSDPFAETDTEKLRENRAWAHRALDVLIDYRMAWEQSSRSKSQPYHSFDPHYYERDNQANELYRTVLMFASSLIGPKAKAFNAEMYYESHPHEMRAALRNVIQKMVMIWPSRPTVITKQYDRRSIQSNDLMIAMIDLDKGHIPLLCKKGRGRDTDLMKERCRFAGVLWSIQLKERRCRSYTAQVAEAFGLGADGNKTVQRWKRAVDDTNIYAFKLGYGDGSHVSSLVSRASMVDICADIDSFGAYIAFNIFGELKPPLDTLNGIGAFYQRLLVKVK